MQGRLKQRSYETREGEKRTVVELEVDEVGPSLAFATAKVTRASRSGGGGGYSGGGQGGQSRPQQSGGGNDPWATPGSRRVARAVAARPLPPGTTRGVLPASAPTSLRSDPPSRPTPIRTTLNHSGLNPLVGPGF